MQTSKWREPIFALHFVLLAGLLTALTGWILHLSSGGRRLRLPALGFFAVVGFLFLGGFFLFRLQILHIPFFSGDPPSLLLLRALPVLAGGPFRIGLPVAVPLVREAVRRPWSKIDALHPFGENGKERLLHFRKRTCFFPQLFRADGVTDEVAQIEHRRAVLRNGRGRKQLRENRPSASVSGCGFDNSHADFLTTEHGPFRGERIHGERHVVCVQNIAAFGVVPAVEVPRRETLEDRVRQHDRIAERHR